MLLPAPPARITRGAPYEDDVRPPVLPVRGPRRTLATVGIRALGERDVDARAAGQAGDRWMRHIVVDAVVRHPVDAVYPYLADPLRWHSFAPAVVYREQLDDGPPRVGTRWRATDRIGPFHIHFFDRLDVLEENRRAVWLSSAPWNSRVEYACTPAGETTVIRADYLGVLSDSLRWQVGWLPDPITHGILARDFRRLDRLLARKARAGARWRAHHEDEEDAPTAG